MTHEKSAVYVNRHEDKDEPAPYGLFEMCGGQLEWFMVDGGQLIMPVKLIEMDGDSINGEPIVGLKQYGGDRLARSLLMENIEAGDRFTIQENELGNFVLEPVS